MTVGTQAKSVVRKELLYTAITASVQNSSEMPQRVAAQPSGSRLKGFSTLML
jgi:hypothetical protein